MERSILGNRILTAYGFSKTDDFLEKLLALNLELAEKEKNGESALTSGRSETIESKIPDRLSVSLSFHRKFVDSVDFVVINGIKGRIDGGRLDGCDEGLA